MALLQLTESKLDVGEAFAQGGRLAVGVSAKTPLKRFPRRRQLTLAEVPKAPREAGVDGLVARAVLIAPFL